MYLQNALHGTTDNILNVDPCNTQKRSLSSKDVGVIVDDWCLEQYKDVEALQRSYKEIVKEKLNYT